MSIKGPNNATGYVATPFATTRGSLAPFSVLQWVKDINAADSGYFGTGAGFFNTGNNAFTSVIFSGTGGWSIEESDTGTFDSGGPTLDAMHAGVWMPMLSVFKADGTRYGYNTTTGAIVSDSGTPSLTNPYTHFGIGFVNAARDSGATWITTVAIGHVAVWKCELSQADWFELKGGANPLTVRPDSLLFYWPLDGHLQDLGPMGLGLQQLGTSPTYSFYEEPPVDVPPRRVLFSAIPPVSGTISATTRKPASSIAALRGNIGTLSATTRKPTSSITGSETFSATVAATARKPASSITGSEIYSGTISATTRKPASSDTATETFSATLTPTARKPASNIIALAGNIGTITPTTRKPASAISTAEVFSASISATTRKPTVSATGLSGYIATINATASKPIAVESGVEVFSAIFSPTTRKPASNISGGITQPSSISASTRKPALAVSGSEIFAATISGSARKPAANFASSGIFGGAISSTTRKPSSNLNVAEIYAGTIALSARKPATDFEVNNQEANVTSSISATASKARVQIFAHDPAPKSRPVIIWTT